MEGVRFTDDAFELAVEHDVDLLTVEGTGEDGRIVKADVERAVDEDGPGRKVKVEGLRSDEERERRGRTFELKRVKLDEERTDEDGESIDD